jgi:iron complex transport system ATP-binding protein
MALHDLGQAARYASRLVLLKDGAVLADGPPEVVLTPDLIGVTFGVEVEILRGAGGTPAVVPLRAKLVH